MHTSVVGFCSRQACRDSNSAWRKSYRVQQRSDWFTGGLFVSLNAVVAAASVGPELGSEPPAGRRAGWPAAVNTLAASYNSSLRGEGCVCFSFRKHKESGGPGRQTRNKEPPQHLISMLPDCVPQCEGEGSQ